MTIDKKEFDSETLEDELRADRLGKELVEKFYLDIVAAGKSEQEASDLAKSADYYLRDFLISIKQRNLFEERGGVVRQFAGNWYITSTLEPQIGELARYLEGIEAFYRYLHERKLISDIFFKRIEKECADLSFYEERIESFWNIAGDGYSEWEKSCSLKD